MKGQFKKDKISEDINKKEFKLMNFCASWSMPCIKQCSILEDLSAILQDRIEIERVNIDDPGSDTDGYNINAVPTLCLIKAGKEIKRFIGVQHLDTLLEAVKIHTEEGKYNCRRKID